MKGRRNAAIMLRSQNRKKKIQLAAAATGLKRKQMFECLVLSSIIIKPLSCCARAEAPPHEHDLASELRIAKMHHRQMF